MRKYIVIAVTVVLFVASYWAIAETVTIKAFVRANEKGTF